MNIKLIDSVPNGEFEEINIEQQFVYKTNVSQERFTLFTDRFSSLIEKRCPIKYTSAGMPTLDKIIEDALVQQNFEHQILKSDPDIHFLVPR